MRNEEENRKQIVKAIDVVENALELRPAPRQVPARPKPCRKAGAGAPPAAMRFAHKVLTQAKVADRRNRAATAAAQLGAMDFVPNTYRRTTPRKPKP